MLPKHKVSFYVQNDGVGSIYSINSKGICSLHCQGGWKVCTFPPDYVQEHSNIHSYYYRSLKYHILKIISVLTHSGTWHRIWFLLSCCVPLTPPSKKIPVITISLLETSLIYLLWANFLFFSFFITNQLQQQCPSWEGTFSNVEHIILWCSTW